jgi:hypothetical protein
LAVEVASVAESGLSTGKTLAKAKLDGKGRWEGLMGRQNWMGRADGKGRWEGKTLKAKLDGKG